MPNTLTMIKGEAKTWKFTAVDASSSAVALSGATLALTVEKENTPSSAAITKASSKFSKSSGAIGIVTVPIGAASTASLNAGYYTGQLTTTLSETNIDKFKFHLNLKETL